MDDSTDVPAVEVLDQNSPQTEPKDRPRWPWVAAGAAALAVGGAGIALGMALAGGGAQPEDLVPANALVYADVDLDPGAGQKVNLVRLLSRFPEIERQLGDRGDIKDYVITHIVEEFGAVDADEVSSWVGDRAGVAVVWDEATNSASVVVAVQVTDQADAKQTLTGSLSEDEYAFTSGYVLITRNLGLRGSASAISASDIVAAGAARPLAEDRAFQESMDPLGAGIGSLFVDVDRLNEAAAGALGGATGVGAFGLSSSEPGGHLAAVLRVEPTAVELVAQSDQTRFGTFSGQTETLSHLPSSTAFAVAFGGGGAAIAKQWKTVVGQLEALPQRGSFDRQLARIEAQYDVRLPADLITVMGDDAVLAVDGDGLLGSVPAIGLRSVTDPERAADLVTRLRPTIAELTAGLGVTIEPVKDGLVVATTPEFADELTSGSGGLLTDPAFVAAVPDAEDASFVMWLDLASLGGVAPLFDPAASGLLEPLEGLGASGGARDGGEYLRLRLTFKDN